MKNRVYWLLKVEIGHRLREGAKGFRLKDIAESVGVTLKPIEAVQMFRDLCAEIEDEGLAVVKHISDQESNYADVVELTDWGADPDAWEP